jgi:tRNA dimethylallyltransferase
VKKQTIIAIVGPTATGKSAIAVAIAKGIAGEVISADSRQVYRGLDIGTGKITPREMRGIPHHLLDVANPKRQYTVVQFQRAAQRAIRAITKREKVPVLTGGTNLYIDALLYDIRFPEIKKNAALRTTLEKKTAQKLFDLLKKQDPRRAAMIDRHNKRRLIRALEIIATGGKTPDLNAPFLAHHPPHWHSPYRTCIIGISRNPEILRKRIDRRLRQRITGGMIQEVVKLKRSGLSWKRLESFGLEYRYVALMLQGKLPQDAYAGTHSRAVRARGFDPRETTALYKILREKIWQYAKRQTTWLKRNPNIIWVKTSREALAVARKHLPSI